jgi:hypothetical protein
MDELATSAFAARSAATTGDFVAANAFAEAHPEPSSFGRLIRVLRIAAGLEAAEQLQDLLQRPPEPQSEAARSAEAFALALAARLLAAGGDAAGSTRAADAARALGSPLTAEASGAVRLAACWAGLDGDDPRSILDEARAVESDMAAIGAASLVIEAACIAAAAARAAGDEEQALSLARRASRMARTESLPQLEYLAHLVLARERADAGFSHLATRILSALGRVAPPIWAGAIGLELALSGEMEAARPLLVRGAPLPATHVGRALVAFADASVSGDGAAARAALDDAIGRARAGSRALQRRAAELSLALDPLAPLNGAADEPIRAFVEGRAELPRHLYGIAGTPLGKEAIGTPYVLAGPGRVPRRVLGLGVSLMDGACVVLGADGDRKHRTRRAAGALLFAGPEGLPRGELFSRVYGFRFRSITHQSVLDVLLHRVREYFGDAASMSRDDEQVRLELHSVVAVPDPPAERPLDDVVLRAVARNPGLSAKALSKELGVALRSVQTSLRSLVESGDCLAERNGRAVEYRVEDTTFSEPTRLTVAT